MTRLDTEHTKNADRVQPCQGNRFRSSHSITFLKNTKRKRKAGLLSLSDTAYFLLSLCKPPITHEWALHGPQTSLNLLKHSISNVSRSVQKVLKYCSESAKRKLALVNTKFHQSHNLLPRLGFEGSTAVKWWIYLIYMRVIHKIIWTDRLTPTSLAVRRKRCTSVSFLNSANICEARFCTNMTWHIFFHFQTFAVRCKSHPLTHSNALERFPSFSHLSLTFLIAETNLSALAPPFILKCLPDLQCNTFSYFWSHPPFSVRPALLVAPGEASWMESSGHQR